MVIKQVPEGAAGSVRGRANCRPGDTDQLACSWMARSVQSARGLSFCIVRCCQGCPAPLWLEMSRKLRQMAQVQTRVLPRGETGLALQSGVPAGHRPAPHLLVFSKAQVQQLWFSPVIPAVRPPHPPKKTVEHAPCKERGPRRGRSSSVSGAQLCRQNEWAGLTEVHCISNGFAVNCSA